MRTFLRLLVALAVALCCPALACEMGEWAAGADEDLDDVE